MVILLHSKNFISKSYMNYKNLSPDEYEMTRYLGHPNGEEVYHFYNVRKKE